MTEKVDPSVVPGAAEWLKRQEDWQSEVRNDPEIGGAKFDRVVLPTIARAMDRYGDPGLREALSMTGAGNNPAIIRTLYTLSRMVTEGRLVQGNARPPTSPPTIEQRLERLEQEVARLRSLALPVERMG